MSSNEKEDKSCQTDEDLIYNYAWTKFYYHFQTHTTQQQQKEKQNPDVEMKDVRTSEQPMTSAAAAAERLDADAIKKIAEESLEARGFLYEPSTGLYYDTQNDLFYDQDSQLYLDIVNRINYKFVLNERTNVYQLRYASKMSRAECKRLRNYLKRSDLFEVEEASAAEATAKIGNKQRNNDKEDGEESASSSSNNSTQVSSSSSSASSTTKRRRHRDKKSSKKNKKAKKKKSHTHKKDKSKKKKKKQRNSSSSSDNSENEENRVDDDEDEEEEEEDKVEIIDLANQYPPCIRAILIEYDIDDDDDLDDVKLGSLFIVPYTGGVIGRATSKCIVSFPKAKEIEKEHAKIEYDMKRILYQSKLGTFVNKAKLEAEKSVALKHGDEVNLGELITFLVHIHWGSNSCSDCEPGEVMSRFKHEKERLEREMLLLNLTREEARKETLKNIKKKYGLKFNDFDKPPTAQSNSSYKDRAAERRNQFGTETEAKKETASKASVHVAISENNLGRKMLQKMGWKQGQGLGKNEEGITEPISTNVKLDNSGLGSNANNHCSMDVDERQKKRIINMKKTQERYQASN